MKKIWFFYLIAAFNLFSYEYINSLPNGSFEGQGFWSDNNGQSGNYQAWAELSGNQLASSYKFTHLDVSIRIDLLFSDNGWFDVKFAEDNVGKGFCMQYQCQYDLEINGGKVHETFTFEGENLYRFGYKQYADKIIRWEERLSPAAWISIP